MQLLLFIFTVYYLFWITVYDCRRTVGYGNFTVYASVLQPRRDASILPLFYNATTVIHFYSILLFFWITVYDCRITMGVVVIS